MDYIEILMPTSAAVLLGGWIGMERQVSGHSAGLRTHMLVWLRAAIFVLFCRKLTSQSTVELTRVVQGIATGVGFIGTGAILKSNYEHEVFGLTSAAQSGFRLRLALPADRANTLWV